MTESKKISILHFPSHDEPFVILDKPRGLPSAPLFAGDESAMTCILEKFPEAYKVMGKKEIEHGLVHRIDTETEGLLLVALNQDFYDLMMEEQSSGRFLKTYDALCEPICFCEENEFQNERIGFPSLDPKLQAGVSLFLASEYSSMPLKIHSRFRPYGLKNREVRPVNQFSGKAALKKASAKEYSTEVFLNKNESGVFAKCRISEGFRHQVRCHLSWLGFPVKGDFLYNPCFEPEQKMEFIASGLEFLGMSFSL